MTLGLSATVANAILDSLCSGATWTAPAAAWIQLHIGDPGAAGTGNPAGNTTRIQGVFAAAAAGTITTSTATTWPNVSTSETYTRFSVWDAASGGSFQFSGTIIATGAVTNGDDFNAAAGQLVASLTVAA